MNTPTSETVGNGLCAVPHRKDGTVTSKRQYPKARYKSFPSGEAGRAQP